jgi:PAS domain-containing protein
MDCKTARLLLDFARPQAGELEAEEAAALESHLDHCPDCHSQARGERQFDASLGRAMRQVELPAGLREQLLARLEQQHSDWYRQRFARTARRLVAAAALLLLGWGACYWVMDWVVTSIEPGRVAEWAESENAEDPRTRTEAALKRMGVATRLPDLDYHYVVCPPSWAELPGYPGQKMPMLLFERSGQVARVYLIRKKAIRPDTPDKAGGGTFKAELLPPDGEPYRFLVIHDGENIDWLQPPQPPQA